MPWATPRSVHYILTEERVLIEASGEKAAQLCGVAVHGRVRVQGEAEELKFHLYSPQNRY